MKRIKYEWLPTDPGAPNTLKIVSEESNLEIAQLVLEKYYSKKTWCFRPTAFTDTIIEEHLGERWREATFHGFSRVQKFKQWVEYTIVKKEMLHYQ